MEDRGVASWAKGREDEFFDPVPYDVGNPDAALDDLVRRIGSNVCVDVDVTGGLRDAQLLIAHAIEFMLVGMAQEDSVRLGTTVYASIDFKQNPPRGTMLCQEDTYKMSGLISSVDAFA